MLNSDENRRKIVLKFPKLKGDSDFKVIKKSCPDYNCFAWAAHHDDVFWTPLPEDKRPLLFDGISYNWPYESTDDTQLTTMVRLYGKLGYEECQDGSIEDGFRKIALYGTNDAVTHAARQLVSPKVRGKWTSKLGSWFCIQHGDASTIEGDDYGQVIKYMKMPFRIGSGSGSL